MTDTSEYVEGIRAALMVQYPAVPPCLDVGTEPASDFGIAHTGGLAPNGCVLMTYDLGYRPTYHTVVHEIGHALNELIADKEGVLLWDQASCVQDFWLLRGFPVSINEANTQSIELGAKGWQFASWQHIPAEVFAEEFSAAICNDGVCITWNWGAARDDAMLRGYFARLGRGGSGLFKDDPDAQAYVVDARNTFEAIKKVLAELSNRQNDIERMVRDYINAHP